MIRDGILWTRILLVEPVMGQLEFIPSATNDTSTTFIVRFPSRNEQGARSWIELLPDIASP